MLTCTKLFEPSVVKGFLTIESLVYVDVQKVTNQVLALIGNGVEFDMIEVEVCPFNLIEHVMGFVSLERKITRDQGVEYNAKRPYISLRAVSSVENFRGHVVWSASNGLELLVIFRRLGKTEINQTHGIIVSYHNIVGLDVTMHNALCVAVVDRLE